MYVNKLIVLMQKDYLFFRKCISYCLQLFSHTAYRQTAYWSVLCNSHGHCWR